MEGKVSRGGEMLLLVKGEIWKVDLILDCLFLYHPHKEGDASFPKKTNHSTSKPSTNPIKHTNPEGGE